MHHPTEGRVSRGVYTQRFLSRSGHVVLVAVDRFGRRVSEALVFKRDDKEAVVRMLRGVLDRLDPYPN